MRGACLAQHAGEAEEAERRQKRRNGWGSQAQWMGLLASRGGSGRVVVGESNGATHQERQANFPNAKPHPLISFLPHSSRDLAPSPWTRSTAWWIPSATSPRTASASSSAATSPTARSSPRWRRGRRSGSSSWASSASSLSSSSSPSTTSSSVPARLTGVQGD
uniref:Uncharacterized protein n=1 Tax=Zea mays TaxID=4577 RepID=A0A804R344_MAIZE